VEEAIHGLPDLSVMDSQISKTGLTDILRDPAFAGTIFAPINEVRFQASCTSS